MRVNEVWHSLCLSRGRYHTEVALLCILSICVHQCRKCNLDHFVYFYNSNSSKLPVMDNALLWVNQIILQIDSTLISHFGTSSPQIWFWDLLNNLRLFLSGYEFHFPPWLFQTCPVLNFPSSFPPTWELISKKATGERTKIWWQTMLSLQTVWPLVSNLTSQISRCFCKLGVSLPSWKGWSKH